MLSGLFEGYALDSAASSRWAGLPSLLGTFSSAPAPAPADSSGEPDAGERGRLLVVDDNSINRDLLRQWLEQQGHAVDEASGGHEALELVRANDYDLILLDLVMPDLNGLEVLDALRREGRLGLSPIIILSASDEIDGVVRCIELGADDYMTRPFNMVLLRARIRAYLELTRYRKRDRHL
jgi:sigma-B regulation protein RsbU (phosphoserine phosphatase)